MVDLINTGNTDADIKNIIDQLSTGTTSGENLEVPPEALINYMTPLVKGVTTALEPALTDMAATVGEVAATIAGAIIRVLWQVSQPLLPTFYHYKGLAEAYAEHGAREGLSNIRPTPLDASTILSLLHKYPGQFDGYQNDLNLAGFSDDRQSALKADYKNLPDIGTISQMMLRELIDPDTARSFLLRNRFRDEDADNIMSLFYTVPGVGDQLRMATRKIWDLPLSLKYGYNDACPDEFIKYCGQVGINEDWTRKLWASHWQVPDYHTGLEMMHRLSPDVVNQTPQRWSTMGMTADEVSTEYSDIDELMNTLDVLPFWRKRLKAISYTPLSQRYMLRLYASGVMNDQDVFCAYKEMGFDDINAARMTAFCQLDSVNKEKDLTKEEILKAYDEKLITVDIVTQYLTALKYSADEISLLIAMHDYALEKKIKDARLNAIKANYLHHGFDDTTVQHELAKLALTAAEIDSYFQTWSIEKESKTSVLSNTDLRNALVNDLITVEDFRARMDAKGYQPGDIDIIIQIESLKQQAKLKTSAAADQSEA